VCRQGCCEFYFLGLKIRIPCCISAKCQVCLFCQLTRCIRFKCVILWRPKLNGFWCLISLGWFCVCCLVTSNSNNLCWPIEGVEGIVVNDENRERRSDFENSEDERRRSKIGNFKKKALNASNKLTHSFKKRGKRIIDNGVSSVSIEDVRDAKEESAVHELRQKLLERDLLPPGHDDYHTLLRSAYSYFWNTVQSLLWTWTAVFACLFKSTRMHWLIDTVIFNLVDFWKQESLTLIKQSRCGKKCLTGGKNTGQTPF